MPARDSRYPAGAQGRCSTCGFLAKHAQPTGRQLPTPTYYEFEEHERALGAAFAHVPDTWVGEVPTEPACFRHVINVWEEMAPALGSGLEKSEAARLVIAAARHCDRWTPYTPGFTPKEHLEELRTASLEEERRSWEERQEQDRRGFEADLEARSRKTSWIIGGAALVLALAGVSAAIVQIVIAL